VTGPDVEVGPATAPRDDHGPAFWIGLVLGGAVMAFGVRGALGQSRATDPASLVAWVVGADLVHDLLVAPLVIAVGWAAVRLVPARWRPPVRVGLILSGVVLLVGWAPWRGYGRERLADNPSVQPLDYTRNILGLLVVIWLGVAIATWVATRRGRSVTASPRTPPDLPGDRR
jgi:hypothetical protein